MWSRKDQGKKMWIVGGITSNQRQIWVRSRMEKTQQENVVWWWGNLQQDWTPSSQCLTHKPVAGVTLVLSDRVSSSHSDWSFRHSAHHHVCQVCCLSEERMTPNHLFLVCLWIFMPTLKGEWFFQISTTSSLRVPSSAPLKSTSVSRHNKSQGLIYSQQHSSFLMCPQAWWGVLCPGNPQPR